MRKGEKEAGNEFTMCNVDGIDAVGRKISYQSQSKRFSTWRMEVGMMRRDGAKIA